MPLKRILTQNQGVENYLLLESEYNYLKNNKLLQKGGGFMEEKKVNEFVKEVINELKKYFCVGKLIRSVGKCEGYEKIRVIQKWIREQRTILRRAERRISRDNFSDLFVALDLLKTAGTKFYKFYMAQTHTTHIWFPLFKYNREKFFAKLRKIVMSVLEKFFTALDKTEEKISEEVKSKKYIKT